MSPSLHGAQVLRPLVSFLVLAVLAIISIFLRFLRNVSKDSFEFRTSPKIFFGGRLTRLTGARPRIVQSQMFFFVFFFFGQEELSLNHVVTSGHAYYHNCAR